MTLTEAEIVKLTDRKRRPAQARVLRHMGIEHKIRPDGSIAVSRAHAELALSGGAPGTSPTAAPEPDWSSLQCPAPDSRKAKGCRPAGR